MPTGLRQTHRSWLSPEAVGTLVVELAAAETIASSRAPIHGSWIGPLDVEGSHAVVVEAFKRAFYKEAFKELLRDATRRGHPERPPMAEPGVLPSGSTVSVSTESVSGWKHPPLRAWTRVSNSRFPTQQEAS